jgi:Na+/melibiose symporter-like transporter
MVLPGIQALFGFQLIAVFNEGFAQKLSTVEQWIHFVSIVLTVIAVALVMTPAALHRQIDPLSVTRKLNRSSTNLLLWSMFPLAVSIYMEIHLIGHIITIGLVEHFIG